MQKTPHLCGCGILPAPSAASPVAAATPALCIERRSACAVAGSGGSVHESHGMLHLSLSFFLLRDRDRLRRRELLLFLCLSLDRLRDRECRAIAPKVAKRVRVNVDAGALLAACLRGAVRLAPDSVSLCWVNLTGNPNRVHFPGRSPTTPLHIITSVHR